MRRLLYISVLSLMVGVAGCGTRGGGDVKHIVKKQTRPILISLHQKKNSTECEAKYGKRANHAFRNDEIAWEFISTCDNDQTVQLAIKAGSSNPFTDTGAPWSVPVPSGGDNEKLLTVSATASGTYSFNIIVAGKSFDPKLEIDPY